MTIGVGTPIFQAPEIVENKQDYTDKVDVWSLACVFYEIFTGTALFDQLSVEQAQAKIMNHKVNQQEVFNKIHQMNCQGDFKQLMIKMQQPDQQKRIDLSQVLQILKQITNQKQQQPNFQQMGSFNFNNQINRSRGFDSNQVQQDNNNKNGFQSNKLFIRIIQLIQKPMMLLKIKFF